MDASPSDLDRFRDRLELEYADRFPRSRAHHERSTRLLDGTSHAIRWNEPFMPVARRAAGAWFEDIDGHRLVDYWQGHMTNLLGHNPARIRDALQRALAEGSGLQTGMIHELEAEVVDLLCRATGSDVARLTTSGSLGTFYATLLARAFTGREVVLKIRGGWHGSQPFGLKGVSAHGTSFDHMESEGLGGSTQTEIELTRLNDVEDLRRVFERSGDRIACLMLEPMLGAGGGIPATREYLSEARQLTAEHGALLVCDEIVTAFRFRAGDLSAHYGVKPDLLVLGKIIGGGMPVAAVAGRRDVMELCTRAAGRVKFEGGTFSGHELSLVAARELLNHVIEDEGSVYPDLAGKGCRLRDGIRAAAQRCGVPIHVTGDPVDGFPGGSLFHVVVTSAPDAVLACAEDSARLRHPLIGDRLFKSVLMLDDISVRGGGGGISTAHERPDLERTIEAYERAFMRFREAGLVGP
ncbi:MAG: aminotransferase class III-fold pyridoxal phosphate-dependent enzyme [bacterium]|nr:aminotransferase class III-fold pyridoxal phosphate-dependent enzyme [bacterium]